MRLEPLSLFDIEERAKQVLPESLWISINSGAQDGITTARNRAAFKNMTIRPRFFADVTKRDLSTTVLGQEISFPVMLAPAGLQKRAHPEGELASARAAGAVGALMVLSTNSTYSIEDVAKVATGPLWFQLYHLHNDLSEMLLQRAEAAGYTAILITVHRPVPNVRDAVDRIGYITPPDMARVNIAGFRLANIGPGGSPPAVPVTWSQIEWVRSHTRLPLVLKGIMTEEDALECVEHGVDGIVVSNHYGSVIDGAAATIEVLPEVVEAVDGRVEVYLDGGIRRGRDVLASLAYGARAIFIGRPIMWGLAMDGEVGVRKVFGNS